MTLLRMILMLALPLSLWAVAGAQQDTSSTTDQLNRLIQMQKYAEAAHRMETLLEPRILDGEPPAGDLGGLIAKYVQMAFEAYRSSQEQVETFSLSRTYRIITYVPLELRPKIDGWDLWKSTYLELCYVLEARDGQISLEEEQNLFARFGLELKRHCQLLRERIPDLVEREVIKPVNRVIYLLVYYGLSDSGNEYRIKYNIDSDMALVNGTLLPQFQTMTRNKFAWRRWSDYLGLMHDEVPRLNLLLLASTFEPRRDREKDARARQENLNAAWEIMFDLTRRMGALPEVEQANLEVLLSQCDAYFSLDSTKRTFLDTCSVAFQHMFKRFDDLLLTGEFSDSSLIGYQERLNALAVHSALSLLHSADTLVTEAAAGQPTPALNARQVWDLQRARAILAEVMLRRPEHADANLVDLLCLTLAQSQACPAVYIKVYPLLDRVSDDYRDLARRVRAYFAKPVVSTISNR